MEDEKFDLDDYFEIRSANDWLRSAKAVPVPKMLFGEMWFEGEIAIMFGDTGVGKSSLAVQIGEAVARGRTFSTTRSATTPSAEAASTPPQRGGEFGAVTVRPQTVLYLDFELSAKQFEMRYAAEHEAGRGDRLKNHYRFSERLKRIAIKPDVFREDGDCPFESAVRRLIEPLIERTGARVLIVDNITYLKRTADNSRDAAPLMKELKRLKEQFGLSILVIAHTPKRDVKRPLVLNDMQGSKVIANFADSVFAIGESHRESNERYIKHIKQRSSEMLHGRGALPVFRMGKLGGNFLGLEFRQYAAENEMLRESADSHAWATIQMAKDLSDAGLTIRQIAEQLGLSKSAAHRYLQMWHPSLSSPAAFKG